MQSEHPDCTIGQGRSLKFSAGWSLSENDKGLLEIDLATCTKLLSELIPAEKQVQIFGHSGKNFEQLQEIAAFAGNGVSWSQTRRNDSCYSHLVENASDWKLFMHINVIPELAQSLGSRALYLLIRQGDLEQQNYDKSWLLFD